MTEHERIAELEAQLSELQADYERSSAALRNAHLIVRNRDATIADLRLELGQTKYALSRARMREISNDIS